MSSTSVSESIAVPWNNIFNFRDTDNFEPFYSKSVLVNNIEFKIELYLNGQNDDEMGYVQFNIILFKIPHNVKSIVLTVRLHCKVRNTSYKQVQILTHKNDIISWPKYQLPLSELEGDTVFGCDIELLQMKYSNSSSIVSNIFGGGNKHNKDNDDEKEQIFTYRPLATTAKVRFEWEID